MTDRTLRVALLALAAAGAAISAYLLWAHVSDSSIVCPTGGCQTVARSDYAEVFGVPVALLGLAGYAGIALSALRTDERSRIAGAAMAFGGLAFAVYLIGVQAVAVDAFCTWCLTSDAVLAAAAALAAVRLRDPVPAPA